MRLAELYEQAAAELIRETGCTIRTERSAMSGRAYVKDADWGIDVPRPRGPVSFAVFAHEVGHQVLHRHGRRPRWLEEIEAEEYALTQFDRFNLPGKERAQINAAKFLSRTAGRSERRCSPATAAKILERYSWVWPLVEEQA